MTSFMLLAGFALTVNLYHSMKSIIEASDAISFMLCVHNHATSCTKNIVIHLHFCYYDVIKYINAPI